MTNSRSGSENVCYKEVLHKIKHKGTKLEDSIFLGLIQKYRIHLKIVDTLAAISGITGIAVQYYLVINK